MAQSEAGHCHFKSRGGPERSPRIAPPLVTPSGDGGFLSVGKSSGEAGEEWEEIQLGNLIPQRGRAVGEPYSVLAAGGPLDAPGPFSRSLRK